MCCLEPFFYSNRSLTRHNNSLLSLLLIPLLPTTAYFFKASMHLTIGRPPPILKQSVSMLLLIVPRTASDISLMFVDVYRGSLSRPIESRLFCEIFLIPRTFEIFRSTGSTTISPIGWWTTMKYRLFLKKSKESILLWSHFWSKYITPLNE